MSDTTDQLPGSVNLGFSPPWNGKDIVAPTGFSLSDIEWVNIALIIPTSTTDTGRLPESPTTYTALLISQDYKLWDGHHRYYQLLNLAWHGDVPVVKNCWIQQPTATCP